MPIRAVLSLSVALASCGGPAGSEPEGRDAPVPLQIAFDGLCEAETLATGGDLGGASEAFQARAHAYLHELAAEVSDADRSAAAELLEAKEAVETHLASPDGDPSVVAGALAELRSAVADAAETLGHARPGCAGAA